MPYIKQEDRPQITMRMAQASTKIKTPGDLNYAISMLCKYYLAQRGMSYTNANEVMGVLECAKLELYRRRLAPYEDTKIEENGDI